MNTSAKGYHQEEDDRYAEGEDTPLLFAKPNERSTSSTTNLIPAELRAKGYYFSRWQAFSGVCLYVSMVGTTYAFSVYSTLLEENLDFSSDDLDLVASVGNTGLYLSLVGGILLEMYGLHFVVGLGAGLILLGFGYIYLAVSMILPANLLSVSIAFFLSQFGVCCHISSAVTTAVRLFPRESRGAAVGLTKGYFALSSAVLSDLASGYFSTNHSYFILFIAITLPTMSLLGVSMVNELPANLVTLDFDKNRGVRTSLMPFFGHFTTLFLSIFVLGYVMYAFDLSIDIKMFGSSIVSAIVICVVLVVPGYYGSRIISVTEVSYDLTRSRTSYHVSKDQTERRRQDHRPVFSRTSSTDSARSTKFPDEDNNIISEIQDIFVGSSKAEKDADVTVGPSDVDLAQALDSCFYGNSIPLTESIYTWRFWVIYFAFLTLCGTGLMVIDNINSIAEAVGSSPSTFFVTCVSLANSFGRVFAGFTSDVIAMHVSRLQMMSCVAALMALSHALFAIGSPYLLYPCLLCVGALFGSTVALIAVTVPDIFGGKYVATNFGAVDSAPIFGSYLFVTGLVSWVYTTNTIDDGGDESCVGADCFRVAFLVSSACCAVVSVALLITHQHTPIKPSTSQH